MEKRKVWKLVCLLDKKEKYKFELWLKGELGRNQKTTIRLYQLICEEKSIAEIWKVLYPDKKIPERPFYDSGFRRLEHSLSSLLETYLAFKAFVRDKHVQDVYLLKEFKARNATGLFSAKLKKNIHKLYEEDIRDERFHQRLYLLERENLEFHLDFQTKEIIEYSRRTHQQYEIWWIHEKMRMALMALGLRKSYNDQSFEGILVHSIIEEIEKNEELKQHPVLMIYYRIYLLLEGKAEAGTIVDFVRENLVCLSPDSQKDVFAFLINHYTQRSNSSGKLIYTEKLLVLYEWGIDDSYLLTNNILSWQLFKNVIRIAVKLKQIERAKRYLEDLISLLPEAEREEAYQFNLAIILMTEGNFQKAITIFSHKFSNVFYEIAARINLVKIRYQQGEREELSNELRALKLYSDRKPNINILQKRSMFNEIKLIEKLIRAYGPKAFAKLEEEVLTTRPLANADWLIEQIQTHTLPGRPWLIHE